MVPAACCFPSSAASGDGVGAAAGQGTQKALTQLNTSEMQTCSSEHALKGWAKPAPAALRAVVLCWWCVVLPGLFRITACLGMLLRGGASGTKVLVLLQLAGLAVVLQKAFCRPWHFTKLGLFHFLEVLRPTRCPARFCLP